MSLGKKFGNLVNDSRISRSEFGEDDKQSTYFEIYKPKVICRDGIKVDFGYIKSGNTYLIWNHPTYGSWNNYKWSSSRSDVFSAGSRVIEQELLYVYDDKLTNTTYKDNTNTTADWNGNGSIVLYPGYGGSTTTYTETATADFIGSKYHIVNTNNSLVMGSDVYGSTILLGSEILYLKFENNVNDSIGNYSGSEGTGTYSFHNSYVGSCRHATDTNDKVEITPLVDFTGSSEQTISFWVKINNPFTPGYVCCTGDTNHLGSKLQYIIYFVGSYLRYWLYEDTVTDEYVNSSFALNAGSWYHVVCRKRVGSINMTINNGFMTENNTLSGSNFANKLDTMKTFVFTAYGSPATYGNAFVGSLDDFRIYNRYINDAEIGSLYNVRYYSTGSYIKKIGVGSETILGSAKIVSIGFNSVTPSGANVSGSYKLFQNGSWDASYSSLSGSNTTLNVFDVGSVEILFNFTSDTFAQPELSDWNVIYNPQKYSGNYGLFKFGKNNVGFGSVFEFPQAQSINLGSDIQLNTTKFQKVWINVGGSNIVNLVGSMTTNGGSYWSHVFFNNETSLPTGSIGSEVMYKLVGTGSGKIIVNNINLIYKQSDVV